MKTQATTTAQELAQINIHSKVFDFNINMDTYPKLVLDFDAQSNYKKQAVEKDLELLLERQKAFDKRTGKARIGDYLIHKNGNVSRFTVQWGEGLQAGGGSGSYHISKDGYLSYSGGCGDCFDHKDLELTDEVKAGMVWFFSNDWVGASRSTHGYINFRVYKEI